MYWKDRTILCLCIKVTSIHSNPQTWSDLFPQDIGTECSLDCVGFQNIETFAMLPSFLMMIHYRWSMVFNMASKCQKTIHLWVLSFSFPRIEQIYIKVHLGPNITEICWSEINQPHVTLLGLLVSWGFSGRHGLCKPEHSMSTKRVPGCWVRLERVRIASNQLGYLVCWMMDLSLMELELFDRKFVEPSFSLILAYHVFDALRRKSFVGKRFVVMSDGEHHWYDKHSSGYKELRTAICRNCRRNGWAFSWDCWGILWYILSTAKCELDAQVMPLVFYFDPDDKEKAVGVRMFESKHCLRDCNRKSIRRYWGTCSNRVVRL